MDAIHPTNRFHPETACKICLLVTFGFFVAFYPETVCKMFFLAGMGFVAVLVLVFAVEMIRNCFHSEGSCGTTTSLE